MKQITTSKLTFTLHPGESLLEGLERTGHNVEYQCREGYCGSCRMKVEGQFRYFRLPLASTVQGEVLVCCAIPKTDIVLHTGFIDALYSA